MLWKNTILHIFSSSSEGGQAQVVNIHLNKHVVNDKEEVDGFRGHDKDVKATGRLVKTHTLELAAVLERAWSKHSITGNMVLVTSGVNAQLSLSSLTWTTHLWLWSPASV